MQRFAGLNSIEGWNLTLQLSYIIFDRFNVLNPIDNLQKILHYYIYKQFLIVQINILLLKER